MEGGVSAFNVRPVGKRQATGVRGDQGQTDGGRWVLIPHLANGPSPIGIRGHPSPSGETVGAGDVDVGNQFKIDARVVFSDHAFERGSKPRLVRTKHARGSTTEGRLLSVYHSPSPPHKPRKV